MTPSTRDNRLSAQDRFAFLLTARLSEAADQVPHAVSERLKVARMQALSQRKSVIQPRVAATACASGGAVALPLGGNFSGAWNWLGALVAVLILVTGLLGIGVVQDVIHADEIAQVDAELLTDELPPAAYTDPGFAQYLKTLPQEN